MKAPAYVTGVSGRNWPVLMPHRPPNCEANQDSKEHSSGFFFFFFGGDVGTHVKFQAWLAEGEDI